MSPASCGNEHGRQPTIVGVDLVHTPSVVHLSLRNLDREVFSCGDPEKHLAQVVANAYNV
jgi:hypothetical protein